MRFSIIIFSLFLAINLSSQDAFEIRNPSFEGKQARGTVLRSEFESNIQSWYDTQIQDKKQSAPDIHAHAEPHIWEVTAAPSDGNTFLGMVARNDGSYEMIAQELTVPVSQMKCYSFSIDLMKSQTLKSGLNHVVETKNFTSDLKLLILGGNDGFVPDEVLHTSESVGHHDWKTYHISFRPTQQYKNLFLQVRCADSSFDDCLGNLLLDNIKDVLSADCVE